MTTRRISPWLGEIVREGPMRVPARFYLPAGAAVEEQALAQLAGVACLPGIVGYALAMPDMHWGYGFPIGGVAAVDARDGAVSPGGVGYDINCGVRLLATELTASGVHPWLDRLAQALFAAVPTGVGASAAVPPLGKQALDGVLREGAGWAVREGYGVGADDLDHTEEYGCLRGARPDAVSETARRRGRDQLGTLGSGNHFLELDVVDTVFLPDVASAFGLHEGHVAVMIHSGSRGLGHQVCDDTLGILARSMAAYGEAYARIPDRQLACAPIRSEEGQRYLGAMQAAANFAWANRQVMSALALRAIERELGIGPAEHGARLVYDVCHNIAKFEDHVVDGERRRLLVHRKGATRAFGPGDERLPPAYRGTGQPVIVPGDMGRCSYVLVGTTAAMEKTFGSACHGAGRLLSRHQALKDARGRRIDEELRLRGIHVVARARRTLGEEMSEAYKDVSEVVDVLVAEGIVRKVARLRPLAVIKG